MNLNNPAIRSEALSRVLPPGAVGAELTGPADAALLMPEEAQGLGRSIPKRVNEFTAGRLCARHALAEFQVFGEPIRAAEDRQPVWPSGFVGSITHTEGYAAAAVARRLEWAALGIDTENADRVHAELWPRICLPGELRWLESLGAAHRPAAAALLFCAKEAFYKCQYPLTRQWLYFHDVSVEVPRWGEGRGEFEVRPVRPIALEARHVSPFRGRFLLHQEFVTAGIALAAVNLREPSAQ